MLQVRFNMFETNSSNVNAIVYSDIKGYVDNIKIKYNFSINDVSSDIIDIKNEVSTVLKNKCNLVVDEYTYEKDTLKITGIEYIDNYEHNFRINKFKTLDVYGSDNLYDDIFNKMNNNPKIFNFNAILDTIRENIVSYCDTTQINFDINYRIVGCFNFISGYLDRKTVQAWDDGGYHSNSEDLSGDTWYDMSSNNYHITRTISTDISIADLNTQNTKSLQSQHNISNEDIVSLDYGEQIKTQYKTNDAEVEYTIRCRNPKSNQQRSLWNRGGYNYFDIYADVTDNSRSIKTGYIAEIHRVPKYHKYKTGNIVTKMSSNVAELFYEIVEAHFNNTLGSSDKMK